MEEHLIYNNEDILYTKFFSCNSRETIIVLHGGPGVPNEMELVTQILSTYYQVIVFHQRGTKKSICNTDDYSISAYISDINAISEYFNLDKFHVFGHSWGGLYAQLYAQQFPDKIFSLFLSCSIAGTGKQYVEISREIEKYNISRVNLLTLLKLSFYNLFAKMGSNIAYKKILKVILSNYNKDYRIDPEYQPNVENVKARAINRTRKEIKNFKNLIDVFDNTYKTTIIYGDNDVFMKNKIYLFNKFPISNKFTISNYKHNP
ncbi:MAG: alpha/beta hydrolase [Bacteroidales bacterium]|nr:alpha/beta hydrolase [Bacteroidales bacterium]